MKLDVPYYSQYIDVEDSFWMLRACGACSFKMVVEFHGIKVPDLVSICNEALEKGGYDLQNGWGHDYLVEKAKELGLHSNRAEGLSDLEDIIKSLNDGNPVIVSVEKRVLEQTRFHMVVLVGYENLSANRHGNHFIYHESESTDKDKGAYRVCNEDIFLNYWRGKAIFVSKK